MVNFIYKQNGELYLFFLQVPSLLPKTLHVGQLVSCVVMQVDDDKGEEKGRKRVKLSLRLSALYKGLTLDAIQDGMV